MSVVVFSWLHYVSEEMSCVFLKGSDRIAEYDMKLMDIDADTLNIPETEYDARVTMQSSEFSRIVRDLSQLGESVRIEVSKEGVRFASDGEAANGSVLLRQSDGSHITGSTIKPEDTDGKDKEDEEGDEEAGGSGSGSKKAKVKKEKGDDDVEMEEEEKNDDEGEFKPAEEDDGDGEEEQDQEEENEDDEEDSGSKKRKKKVCEFNSDFSMHLTDSPSKSKDSSKPNKKPKTGKSKSKEDEIAGVIIEMNQHVSLTFSLKYLVNFSKSSTLSNKVQLMMSNDVPLLVCFLLCCCFAVFIHVSF